MNSGKYFKIQKLAKNSGIEKSEIRISEMFPKPL